MSGEDWDHRGKRPRYMAAPRDPEPVPEHVVDPTYNAQGEWVCHRCGELVTFVGKRAGVTGGVQIVEPGLEP